MSMYYDGLDDDAIAAKRAVKLSSNSARRPVLAAQDVAEELGCSPEEARKRLETVVEAGYLSSMTVSDGEHEVTVYW